MDTGKGIFEFAVDTPDARKALEEKHPNHGAWFREGEIIDIKGSVFRVKRIKPNEVTLKLVTRNLLYSKK